MAGGQHRSADNVRDWSHRHRGAVGRAWILLTCIALLAGLASSGIQPPPARAISEAPFGDQVNLSDSPSLSHFPRVASAGSNVYVVWQEYGSPGSTDVIQIAFRRSTHTDEWDQPVFEDTKILAAKLAKPGGGVVSSPHVAAVDSSVFVTWTQVDLTDGRTNIFLVRSTDAGLTFSPPVNLSGTNTAGFLSLIAVTGPDVFVVFADNPRVPCADNFRPWCGYDILGVASSDGGGNFSSPANLSQSRALSDWLPNLGLAASGHNAYAIWGEHSQAPGGGTFGSEIFFASMNNLGEATAPVNLSETPGVQSMQPTIAASGDGVYAAWGEPQGVGSSDEPKDIYLRSSHDRGQTFNPVLNVTHNPGDSAFPEVAASGDNVFLTWMDGSDGRFDVWFTRSTTAGAAFAPLSNLTSVYNARMGTWGLLPNIAVAGNQVHVLWTDGQDILYLGSKEAGADLLGAGPGHSFAPTIIYSGIPGEIAYQQRLSATGGSVYTAWEAGAMTLRFDPEHPELSNRDVYLRGVVGPNPDLELAVVEPVQAPYYANVLAAGKKTKVRVVINNTLIDLEDVAIRLLWQDGTSTQQEIVEHHPLKLGTNEFFMPDKGVITPEGSQLRVTATVDPDHRYDEDDETNNAKEVTLPVKHTRTFRVMYVPVQVNSEVLPCKYVQEFAMRASTFLRATFPVGDEGFQDMVNCAPLSYDQFFGSRLSDSDLDRVLLDLDRLKWFTTVGAGSVDRVVGVVPQNWFKNRTVDATDAIGMAFYGGQSSGVLVEDRYGNEDPGAAETSGDTVAHEIAHTFGWVADGNPMAKPDDPHHFGFRPAPGYWVSAGIPLGSATDFMSWGDVPNGYGWVSADTYQFLLTKLKDDPADPPAIAISGVIYRDGHVELNPWYRMDDVLDRQLGQSGEYTVEYLGQQRETLGTTGFDLNFDGPDIGSGGSETAPFSLRIPDVAGTAEVVLKHGSQVVATRDVTSNPPEVQVTAPTAGQIAAPGVPLTVTWDSSDNDGGTLTHTVSLSRDGGQTWAPIALNVDAQQVTFTPAAVDATTQALVRVTVTDGINTADATSALFTIRTGVGSELTGGPTVNVSDTGLDDPGGQGSMYPVTVSDGSDLYVAWSDYSINGRVIDFSRSLDGGGSFGTLTELGRAITAAPNTAPAMAASNGKVYVAWPGYVPPQSYTHVHMLFRRSTDGGATFQPVQELEPDPAGGAGTSAQVAASGDNVYVLWVDSQTNNLIVRASHDGGASFADAQVVGTAAPLPSLSGTNAVSPRLAADGSSVFVIWSSYADGKNDVFLNHSTDAGATFVGPVKLSNNPSAGQADLEPRLAMADGRLYVAWREVQLTDPSTVNHLFLRSSADGGATFSPTLDLRPQWPASSPLEYGSLKSFRLTASGSDVYLAWISGPVGGSGDPANGQDLILLSASHDHGASFADPARIGVASNDYLFDAPQVAASGGNVFVAWDESNRREAPSNVIWLKGSTNGGASFGDQIEIAPTAYGDTPMVLASILAVADGARVLWRGHPSTRTADSDIFLSPVQATVSTNQPPEADAGADQTVAAGNVVTLAGVATDPDGDAMNVSWKQVDGPPVSPETTGGSVLTLLAPEVAGPTTLTFQFTATDGLASSTDTVAVTVTRRAPITNFETQYPEIWSLYIAPALDQGPPVLPEQGDVIPPSVTGTPDRAPDDNGWYNHAVTITWTGQDDSGAVTCDAPTVYSGPDGSAVTIEGRCTDAAGNVGIGSVTLKYDATAPTATCTVTPTVLWPPDHKLVTVTTSVVVTDQEGLSGPAGFTLVSVTSSEPDNGLGDGDTPDDIRGWTVNTPDTEGQLRAERAGTGTGRVYTLTYQGSDTAGNAATCTTTVSVPHDRRP